MLEAMGVSSLEKHYRTVRLQRDLRRRIHRSHSAAPRNVAPSRYVWWLRTIAVLGAIATLLCVVAKSTGRASGHAGSTTTVAAGPTSQRYRTRVFASVAVSRNIVYGVAVDHGGFPVALSLDVYEPVGDGASDRPAIVWLHSGGFIAGNKTEMAALARDAAQRGYVAISADYRQRPAMPWFDITQRRDAERDAYDDAVAAIVFVRSHAATYRIDPSLIFVGGYSAGAITAYDLAYPPTGAQTAHIAGSIPIVGYPYGKPQHAAPPVLAFHGTADPLVPYASDALACNVARSVGDQCQLVTFVAGHEIGTTKFSFISDRAAAFLAPIVARRQ